MLTTDEFETLAGLRDRGFAVIVWTPDELAGVDPEDISNHSISYGWDFIDTNKPPTDEEE